jgi:hypothetical protein
MDCYAFESTRGGVEGVQYVLPEMEVSELVLSPGWSDFLLWLDRWFTGGDHALA